MNVKAKSTTAQAKRNAAATEVRVILGVDLSNMTVTRVRAAGKAYATVVASTEDERTKASNLLALHAYALRVAHAEIPAEKVGEYAGLTPTQTSRFVGRGRLLASQPGITEADAITYAYVYSRYNYSAQNMAHALGIKVTAMLDGSDSSHKAIKAEASRLRHGGKPVDAAPSNRKPTPAGAEADKADATTPTDRKRTSAELMAECEVNLSRIAKGSLSTITPEQASTVLALAQQVADAVAALHPVAAKAVEVDAAEAEVALTA